MDMRIIEAAVGAYRGILPARQVVLLDFFKGLWVIQQQLSALKGDTAVVPDALGAPDAPDTLAESASRPRLLPKSDLEAAYWAQTPLLSLAPAALDPEAFAQALEQIATYMVQNAGFGSAVCEALSSYDWEAFVAASDFAQAGVDPHAYLASCASLIELSAAGDASAAAPTTAKPLLLVVAYALRTQLEPAAQRLMGTLDVKEGNTIHSKPLHCPVCGGAATSAFVGETPSSLGKGRLLWCSTCGTHWEFERLRCAVCGTQNQGKLHYYHIAGDDTHRLHLCDACGNSMRTTFQDELKAPFSFEV
ncbi:MAG: formate dehydrogenase accessory protein FdhE, partial [Coriobacteriales bacterium]|nr:formate dehydrogenase accessory protein FdhE [Coriobacteriales bacterium]